MILAAGGLSSLFLNHSVPTAVRRLGVRQRLSKLGGRLARIPQLIDSHIRVELRVIRLELSRRLASETVLLPGAGEAIDQAARDTLALEHQVDLVEKIGEVLQHIAAMSANGPPRLLAREEAKLRNRLHVLSHAGVGEPELEALAPQIAEVAASIDRIEKDDGSLRGEVDKEARTYWKSSFLPLWNRVMESRAGGASPAWAAGLKDQAGPFVARAGAQFDAADASVNAIGDTLEALDTAYTKLELISDYIRFCEAATPRQQQSFDEPGFDGPWVGGPSATADGAGEPPESDATRLSQRDRFMRCLSGKGRSSLGQARLVLLQAEQGSRSLRRNDRGRREAVHDL